MEESEVKNRAEPGQSRPGRDTTDSCTQTDSRLQGEPNRDRVHVVMVKVSVLLHHKTAELLKRSGRACLPDIAMSIMIMIISPK